MNILIVTEFYSPHVGGVETVFEELSKKFVKNGHKVKIVTTKLKGTKNKSHQGQVEILRVKVFQFLHRYMFTFASIPILLREAGWADIIQTTTYNSAFPAWIAAKILRKPCILMVHEVWIGKWHSLLQLSKPKAFIFNCIEKFILFLPFDKYVCVSNATAKDLEAYGIKKNKIEVIHHGIDNNLFNNDVNLKKTSELRRDLQLDDCFVYTFFGRPGVSKGVEYLIEAFPVVLKAVPKSKLLLILSVDNQNDARFKYVKDLIEKLNIKEFVHIISSVPRSSLPDYIKMSDCIVVPSLTEGFGFCAAEACACGTPIAVSKIASLPEVVSGKVSFMKIKDPISIANSLIDIYQKKYEVIPNKEFSWDKSVERYINLYKKIVIGK